MPLCSLCEQVTPWTLKAIRFNNANAADSKLCNPHHQSFLALQESSHKCELCRLLCNALRENKYTPGIQLQRDLPIFLASVIHRNSDHRIEAPQVYNIVVQCGKVFALLYASADPQSEAAISHAVAGRLPLPPESQEHVEMVATWLEECRRHHPACKIDQMGQNSESALQRKTSELPRRVIDTGTSLDSTIRLVESLGSEEYYVASSHRRPTDPAKHYTTTRATIKNRRKSMSLEDMPRVFQDAVTATRKLGFRYLWIDSLCIIQDDPLDWEEQSVLMGHIYYYASITIMSATTPIPSKKFYQEDSPEGFLYRVPELLKLPTVTMDYYDEKWQVKGNWIIQDRPIYLSRNLELLTRGWVLQEELLSRRKIIYAPDQTLWQCRSAQHFEVNRDIKRTFEGFQNYSSFQDREFCDHWLGSVETYSDRKLTFESDRLPALSGLAAHFSLRHQQEYYAGVFGGSVAEALLWGPAEPGCLVRPQKYIAPSWSWLSLLGRIKMLSPPQMSEDPNFSETLTKSALEDVRFALVPEGQNPYGHLKGGNMGVTGWLLSAAMTRHSIALDILMNLDANGKRMCSFTIDLIEYAPPPEEMQEVECLYVLQDVEHVLVLRKVEGVDEYVRIGIATIDPVWFREGAATKKRIKIV